MEITRQTRPSVLGICVVLLLVGAVSPGCNGDAETTQTGSEMNVPPIDKVLESHTAELMGIPGVVGVYQGALEDGTPCITVMVVASTPELEARIPKKLEGHPVVIEAGGEIRPLGGDKQP